MKFDFLLVFWLLDLLKKYKREMKFMYRLELYDLKNNDSNDPSLFRI